MLFTLALALPCPTLLAAQAVSRPSEALASNAPIRVAASQPSPANQPPQPASITLHSGLLEITANNSSVREILNQLAHKSGMQITGLDRDYRVFGNYGPASPSAVLGQLLEGSGFNLIMIGQTQDGVPRQLRLSQQGTLPAPTSAFNTDSAPNNEPPRQSYQPTPPPQQQQPVQNSLLPPGFRPDQIHSPQQFFEMLQKRREQLQEEQAQQQQQPSSPQ